MADDNKQGFWDYMGQQFKDTFLSPGEQYKTTKSVGSWLLRGINNIFTQRDWGDENTTFEQAINGQTIPDSKPNIDMYTYDPYNIGDGTTEKEDTGLTEDPINLTTLTTSPPTNGGLTNDANATISSGSFVDIDNLEVQDMAKKQERLEEIDDENVLQTIARWGKGKYNEIYTSVLGSQLDSARQANEKHLMLRYDPDSRDVTELVINEGQGYSDDFWNTLYGRGSGNAEVFNRLYTEYQQGLANIYYSDLSEQEKNKGYYELFNAFLQEVNDRELLKAFKNDRYSDGLLWGTLGGEIDFKGRLDNKFTKEQLEAASKREYIPEGVYKPTPEEFQNFLEVYEENNNLKDELSIEGFYGKGNEPEKRNISILLTEDSIAEMQAQQANSILEPIRVKVLDLIDSGEVTPGEGNKIYTSLMKAVNERISNMHFWLDTPLALYTMAKNKETDLTDGEKAVLRYGPGLQELMQKYVDAVGVWGLETLKNVRDGEIISAPDMIDGMSINDFFKSAIEDAYYKAGGTKDLYAGESAIDAMQLINNNISYLFRSGKGNKLRRNWQDVQRELGNVGYTAGELSSLGFNGIAQGIDYLAGQAGYTSLVSDYMMADMMAGLDVKTDVNAGEFWRLAGRFGGKMLENVPEFLGEVATLQFAYPKTSKFSTFSKLFKGADKASDINKQVRATQKLGLVKSAIKKVRDAIGVPASQVGPRNWINRMVNGLLKSAEGENLITNNLVKIGKNMGKGFISDQIADGLVSYYDTEAYSDLSFILSLGFSGVTELLTPAIKDTQILKMIRNKLDGRGFTDGTAWKVMSYLNTDEKALKRLELIFGKGNIGLETLKAIGKQRDEYEDIMKKAYEILKESGVDLDDFSKQVVFEQLRKLGNMDWDSKLGREIINLVKARGTNAADMFKLIFGVPGQVQVGGFISKILLKAPGEGLQTRLLKKDYDVALDILDGGFRKRLKNGFTLEDVKELQSKTRHKDLIKGGDANEKFFAKEGDKYYLTSDGATEFKLDVSEYTESMRRADMRRATEEETKQLIDEKTKQLMSNKGLTKTEIERLASSGAFKKMVDNIATATCKIR